MSDARHVVTLTPNPAVDKVLWVERLEPGAFHRLRAAQSFGSGKGVNVSLALAALGQSSTAVYPAGGDAGRIVDAALAAAGARRRMIAITGATRTNTKVIEADGRCTELNEPGPRLSGAERAQLLEATLAAAKGAAWVVLSGSLPAGLDTTYVTETLRRLQALDPPPALALDTSGAALQAFRAVPGLLLKPNAEEAAELLGTPIAGVEEAVVACRRLLAEGAGAVLLSLGAQGAVYADAEGAWSQPAPGTGELGPVVSTVGCGDTLLAAWLYARGRGVGKPEALAFAVRAASVKATRPYGSYPSLEQVEVAHG
ncbi:MAG TPA: hexose kinase [Limnochordia bacterium]|nr:hexose kinase [Limnochordia bacterium]